MAAPCLAKTKEPVSLHTVVVSYRKERRAVQSQVSRHPGAILRGGILTQHEYHRIAHETEQGKGNQTYGEHHEQRLHQSPQNEREHGILGLA